jgi:putative DNA primase/helicase
MGTIFELGKETVLRLYGEAQKAPSKERREELATWAIKCEKPSSVNMLLESAKSDPLITVHFSKFDPDPLQLNLKNGWYDFREMQFHPHDKDRFFTMMIPVEYDPVAACPMWEAFLERIFRGHDEKENLIEFLQRAVGYTLTGETVERAVFLMHGLGANGKTVFVGVLESLFGDYGASVSSTTFTTAMATNVRNDLARLKGKRFIWASENASETVLDEELVKRITGGDTITCRFLFKEEFEYRPNFKVWWVFNHKPKIKDSTDSIWDRIHLIPCEEKIPKEEQDKYLGEKLKTELPGILNWALEGYKKYRLQGKLNPPRPVVEATRDYRQSEDVLADFLEATFDVIQTGETLADVRMPFARIWELWKDFTTTNNERQRSKQWLGRRLEERFTKYHTSTEKGYVGLHVKPPG